MYQHLVNLTSAYFLTKGYGNVSDKEPVAVICEILLQLYIHVQLKFPNPQSENMSKISDGCRYGLQ